VRTLLLLALAALVGVALLRRAQAASRQRQHGTPDHWPPVVRKPGAAVATTAGAAGGAGHTRR